MILLKKSSYIGGTALLGALFATQPAIAQTVQEDRLGLEFVLELRHDSNIARASPDRAEQRDIELSDQIISPALRLDAYKSLGPHTVFASAYAGYDFYARNSRLDKERLALQGGAALDLRPCEITPTVDFSRRRSEFLNQPIIGDPLAAIDNVQTEQSYGVGASCGGVLGLRPEAGLSYTKGHNSNPLRELADFESVQGRLGVGYRHPSIGNLSLYYSKQRTKFDNRVLNGRHERYEVERIGLSAQRDIGAKLAWNSQIYLVNTSSGFSGNGFEGLGYNAALTFRATPQLRARASFGRDVQTSLNNDALYTINETYGADLDYVVNQRLSLRGGYTLTNRDYTYSSFFEPLPPEVLLDEKLHTVNVGADYRRSDRLGFSLFGGYQKRQANGVLYDYDGYFVGVGISVGLIR